jgi:plasmid stabilization system protein ParE
MNYKIRISSLAKSHIKEAVSYYKKEASLKVVQNFVKDYEQTLQKIKQNPSEYSDTL